MHPSSSALIAFSDAELETRRIRRISAHLETCEKCRAELQRIVRERSTLEQTAGVPQPEPQTQPGLATVLSAIAGWRRTRTGVGMGEAKARARAQVETYFGVGAAEALLDTPDVGPGELVTRALALANTFLGPDAADAVMHDVLGAMNCTALAAEVDE